MKTIAVFFGGKSTEHDVSIVTAISSIIKPLELSKRQYTLLKMVLGIGVINTKISVIIRAVGLTN